MTSPLLLLAEKVEGLSGPDREVDAEIAAAFRVGTEHGWALRYPAWIAAKDGRVHLEKNGPSFAAPRYTASLDSAMALAPEGCQVQRFAELWRTRCWTAEIAARPSAKTLEAFDAGRTVGYETWACISARTPALALVAASLRARAAMEAGE